MNQWWWRCPKAIRLAKLRTIALHELADEPFVIYARNAKRQSFDEFIALCHLAGFSPTIAQEAATESAVIGLVAAGLGVTLVASSLSSVRSDEVAYRQLVDPPLTVEVVVVWKEESAAAVSAGATSDCAGGDAARCHRREQIGLARAARMGSDMPLQGA